MSTPTAAQPAVRFTVGDVGPAGDGGEPVQQILPHPLLPADVRHVIRGIRIDDYTPQGVEEAIGRYWQCIDALAADGISCEVIDLRCQQLFGFIPEYDLEWASLKTLDGVAADDGAALHFVDGKLLRAVSARPRAKAYRLMRSGKRAVEIADWNELRSITEVGSHRMAAAVGTLIPMQPRETRLRADCAGADHDVIGAINRAIALKQ